MCFSGRTFVHRATAWSLAVLTAAVVCACVTCTISDNNGNPAQPDIYSPDDGGDEWPTTGVLNPVLLVSQPYDIVPGDTLAIIVTLYDETNYRGDSIRFVRGAHIAVTVSPDSGWWAPETLVTNRDGRDTLYYTSDTEGHREITFRYGRYVAGPIEFDITQTPTTIERLFSVYPESPTLTADSKSTTNVYVRVLNRDHNPLVGEQVRFIASAGTIKGQNPPSPDMSGVAVTNEDGIAIATLTSTNINDTALINAFLLADQSMNGQTEVVFQGVHISLDIDTNNIGVGNDALLTAVVLNGADEPIARSPIYFLLGGGANSNFQIRDVSDTLTDHEGTASVLLNGVRSGSDSVIVASAGARAAVTINVTNLKLTVRLDQTRLVANDTVTTPLTVDFTTANGTPLGGKVVRVIRYYPSANGEQLVDTLSGNTDGSGTARFTIRGIGHDGTMRLAITAYNTPSDIATAEASIVFSTTRKLTIEALPPIIQADGSSSSEITVQIKNDKGNPIVGDTLSFSTTAGIVTAMAVTDSGGKAVARLRSDRRNVTAMVRTTLQRDPTKKDSVSVVFAGVTVTTNASPRSIRSSGADTSYITAKVTDAAGTPIPGEPINFTPQHRTSTFVIDADAVTDNRGEARCKVVGTGTGRDTLTVVAAGATSRPVIYYSSNILVVDTMPGQPLVANGVDSTRMKITYTNGEGTPLPNVPVNISVTLGNLGVVFARACTTDAGGVAYFYMQNPTFANTATVAAEAITASEITTASVQVYFRASRVYRIKLSVSPKTISTNGDRSTVTAVAYDSLSNRVADATIAFNLIEGPGGGERLDPPTAQTGHDGVATTSLVSGTVPSLFNEVEIVAGDFYAIKSDTARLTIAGPPHAVSVGYNVLKGINPNDGTFELPCAAVVTDVNGNPVAEGTEVTFSCKITGYRVWKYTARWWGDVETWVGHVWADIDTTWEILPFEDLNDNYRLDAGEDRNNDGIASRGEDKNGDGIYVPGPGFEDINHNGVRDSFPEPFRKYDRIVHRPVVDSATNDTTWETTMQPDTAWADFNGNNILDLVEPLRGTIYRGMTWEEYVAMRDAAQEGAGFDFDFDQNGVPDPATSVSIRRTVQTDATGKATNSIIYVQSDATRIQVTLWAESQGVVTKSPQTLILPVIE